MGAKLSVSIYFIFSRNVKSNSNVSMFTRFPRVSSPRLRISEGSAVGLYVYRCTYVHRTSQWVVRKSFRVVHSSWCFCNSLKRYDKIWWILALDVSIWKSGARGCLRSTPFKSVRGGLSQTWETRIEQWKKVTFRERGTSVCRKGSWPVTYLAYLRIKDMKNDILLNVQTRKMTPY